MSPQIDGPEWKGTYWITNSKWDQEDLGLPEAGWYTAYGWWQEESQAA